MPRIGNNNYHERSVLSRSPEVKATLEKEGKKLAAGISEGVNEVAKSYTGWNGTKNVTPKAVGIGAGVKGSKTAANAAKATAKAASKSLGRNAAIKAGEKAATKVMVKGAAKGLGIIGFIPDAMDFAKGFARGYSAAGN